MNKLETINVTKSFDGRCIIKDISLQVADNQIVCLLGESGIGKSTLFNVIAGMIKPDSGRVIIDSNDVTGKVGIVGYSFQKDLLLEHRTVLDNVILPLLIKGRKKKEAREEALGYFSLFGLEGAEKLYPKAISGGMRQRAGLLRTYLYSPEIMLLDEPFSALDSLTKAKMHNWYLDISQKYNQSTLMITHDVDEAVYMSDRIYVLSAASDGSAYIKSCVEISRKRENRRGFDLTEEFLQYKKKIHDLL